MKHILKKIRKRLFVSNKQDIVNQLKGNNYISNPNNIASQILDKVEIIEFKYKNHTLYIYNESAALYHIIHSTEKLEKLAISCNQNMKGVCIDIGANVGLFSYFYKYYNPDSTIHLFEPDTRLITTIKRNLNKFDKCYIHEIALSNYIGIQSFFLNNSSSQTNSINKDNVALFANNNEIEQIKVPTTTLKDFTTEHKIKKIDCLKIDVQGAEFEILNDNTEILNNVDQLLLEVCFLMDDTIPTINLVSHYFKKNTPINSIIMGADLKFHN